MNHMLLTPNVNLKKLSKYQKEVAALNICKNNCQDDIIYKILLKHTCTEQFRMYTLNNVPKLKHTGHRVKFNKTVQYNDKSQSDLSIASLFIVSDHCSVNSLCRYDITQKEAMFAGNCTN